MFDFPHGRVVNMMRSGMVQYIRRRGGARGGMESRWAVNLGCYGPHRPVW